MVVVHDEVTISRGLRQHRVRESCTVYDGQLLCEITDSVAQRLERERHGNVPVEIVATSSHEHNCSPEGIGQIQK